MVENVPAPVVETRAPDRPVASWRQRLLAGACASLVVLGVTAAITNTPEKAGTGETRQVATGPTGGQAPGPEETTTTTTTSVALSAEELTTAGAAAAATTPLPPLGPPPSRPGSGTSFVATATVPNVDIYTSPGASARTRQLANPQPSGAPLVMLVREQQAEWVKVLLPIRPNGSSGWVKKEQVRISSTDYYILLGLAAHRITVFNGSSVILDDRIGLGAGGTPTPTGLFFIKELLKPPNPAGAYGPYAYGLSGFSEVLFNFGGGPGALGLHGTNDPSSLGRNVSHGCIRMSNSGITRLAKMLPLGVPVQITA